MLTQGLCGKTCVLFYHNDSAGQRKLFFKSARLFFAKAKSMIDNWSEHYLYEPSQHLDIKVLVGGEDNIKGIAGIGPKRAVSLVNEYGSTYDIIASIPIAGRYKYIEALNQCKDQLLLNYKLMDLVTHCEEALGAENCKQIDEILNLYVGYN